MAKFKTGDHVTILGVATVLKYPLSDIDGGLEVFLCLPKGWIVEPAIQGTRRWGEDKMTMETLVEVD